jgi:aminoglycoside phosphotransferase (APT) family kinase protein
MSEVAGRFTETAMVAAMRQIAERLDAGVADARLLRMTNNAVFALPAAGIVIRITRSFGLDERVHKVVRLARWFAATDAPTIRLVPSIEQPVSVGGLLATVWRYVPPTSPPLSVEDLGDALRGFHTLDAPGFELPRWDPVGDARRRMGDAEYLDEGDRDFLEAWCDRLAPQIADLLLHEDLRLVHGDAHVGNLLRAPDGRILLCDFDSTTIGPWQFDLVPTAVGEARFGRVGVHRRLAAAYGYDVTADPAWPVLRQARELKMIAAALPYLNSAPGVALEVAVRLRSVAGDDERERWTPFAEVGAQP